MTVMLLNFCSPVKARKEKYNGAKTSHDVKTILNSCVVITYLFNLVTIITEIPPTNMPRICILGNIKYLICRSNFWQQVVCMYSINPKIATLLQSNESSYSNTVIGTLAVDVCMGCYIWYREEETGRSHSQPSPCRPLLAVQNVTAHPSTASVPTLYYSMWHYNCLWSLTG